MSDDLLNEIDDVARELTAGEPPRRMRAGVMARIARPSPEGFGAAGTARPRWRGMRVWSPIGVAAAIALAIYLMPERTDAPATSIVEAPREVTPPAPPVVNRPPDPAPAIARSTPAASTPPVVASPARTAVVSAPSQIPFDGPSIDVSPLEEVTAITMNDLANAPLALDPLESIAPIAVNALSIEGDIQ